MEKDFKTTMGENYEMQAAMYAALMSKLKPKGSNFTPPKKKRKKKK
jgi:hypothetical protein